MYLPDVVVEVPWYAHGISSSKPTVSPFGFVTVIPMLMVVPLLTHCSHPLRWKVMVEISVPSSNSAPSAGIVVMSVLTSPTV